MMGSEIGTHAHAGHGLSHMVIQFPERGFVLKRYRDNNGARCKGLCSVPT
ncbi:hypothetical protein CJ030_MR7G001012 [Morella rubra]|uniref:Uncharacterized protein n=1 Tax=Morella rubra TaxID=262757 RepID=A0A6A1V6W2_9ROSI|nr:hypothetical protein CJ030_MR7G001012 [Morella rubra]